MEQTRLQWRRSWQHERQHKRTRALQTQAAEERSAGLPASIAGGALIAARRAWEKKPASNLATGQSLSASELPAKSYLEWRFAQVDDEFLAESLEEVVSQQEESQQVDDTTQADFVQQGNKAVVRRRARAKSAMPASTEQLRHKYRLMAFHFRVVCSRYPSKSWAAKYSPQSFRDHVDWFLGENVADLKAVNPHGVESVRPTWSVVTSMRSEKKQRAERTLQAAPLQTLFTWHASAMTFAHAISSPLWPSVDSEHNKRKSRDQCGESSGRPQDGCSTKETNRSDYHPGHQQQSREKTTREGKQMQESPKRRS